MSNGKAHAFPVSHGHNTGPGMNYRQWLIGQVAAGVGGDLHRLATADILNGKLTPPQARDSIAEQIIAIADAIVRRIDHAS